MTRGVDERDFVPAIGDHLVGADVLGDAAGFARHHVCVTDLVEQRGLTVIHVAHHGDDRRTRSLQGLVVVVAVVEQRLEFHFFLLAGVDQQQIGSNLERKELHLLVGEGHCCGDHFAVVQQEPNDVGSGAVQLGSELLS